MALASLAGGVWADNIDTAARGVYKSFDVLLEGKNQGTTDVDRLQVTGTYLWELGRRGELKIVLPWQRINATTGAAENSATGFKDMTMTYDFAVRDLSRSGVKGRWQVAANIPTGIDGLNASETAAVTALAGAADGFLNPQFGRGFELGVKHFWTHQRGTTQTEYYLGTNQAGGYQVARFAGNQTSTDGIDTYLFGVSRQSTKGRRTWDIGLDAIIFSDTEIVANGTLTETDSDPNYLIRANLSLKHSDRITGRYGFTYQMRDAQDSLQPGIAINPTQNLELGDRIFWNAYVEKKINVHSFWTFGLVGLNTMGATLNNAAVANSSRNEMFTRVGYTRNRDNGAGWSLTTDVGMTGDSRDYSFMGRYFRQF